MRYLSLFLLLGLPFLLAAQPRTGTSLPEVTITGDDGGLVAGGAWNSASHKGKVVTLMYVDPDEKAVNEHVERALKAEKFPRDRYHSVAVVNSGATWKPDSVIKVILKGKQADYPESTYVMDREKVLVRKWKLADDNYHVLTFDKSGKLIYSKAGRMNDADIQELIRLIRSNL